MLFLDGKYHVHMEPNGAWRVTATPIKKEPPCFSKKTQMKLWAMAIQKVTR
jgi:hypothetical protein